MAVDTKVTASMIAHAEQLVSEAHRWNRGHSKVSDHEFYVIPASKPGTAHYTNTAGCSCTGYRHRGICSHVLAVQMRENVATDAEIAAHMAQSAGQFRREEETRRRLITSSPFFQDAPVAVRVRTLSTYERLYPEGEA